MEGNRVSDAARDGTEEVGREGIACLLGRSQRGRGEGGDGPTAATPSILFLEAMDCFLDIGRSRRIAFLAY